MESPCNENPLITFLKHLLNTFSYTIKRGYRRREKAMKVTELWVGAMENNKWVIVIIIVMVMAVGVVAVGVCSGGVAVMMTVGWRQSDGGGVGGRYRGGGRGDGGGRGRGEVAVGRVGGDGGRRWCWHSGVSGGGGEAFVRRHGSGRCYQRFRFTELKKKKQSNPKFPFFCL